MPNFKCRGPSFESQSSIIDHQCRGPSSKAQLLITRHKHRGLKLGAEVWNSYSLRGPTYPFRARGSVLLIALFVLCNRLSEVWVPRTNHKSPNSPPKRWWRSSKALIYSKVRCTLLGLRFRAHWFYCSILLDNPSEVRVPQPDTNFQLPQITLQRLNSETLWLNTLSTFHDPSSNHWTPN